jgi:hypothetical protein
MRVHVCVCVCVCVCIHPHPHYKTHAARSAMGMATSSLHPQNTLKNTHLARSAMGMATSSSSNIWNGWLFFVYRAPAHRTCVCVCVCVCVRARIHTHTRVCPSASRTAINIHPTPRTPHSQGIYPQTYSHNPLHPQSIPVKKIVFLFGAINLRFNGAVHLNNGACTCTHGRPCSLLTSLMCCWSEALSHSMLRSPQSTTSISAGLKICSHHPNHINIQQGFV